MLKRDKPIVFHQAQKDITNCRKRFRVVCCGRRFGKTTLAIAEMAGKAFIKPGSRVCYIAPTHQQARDIAWVDLVKICEPITTKLNQTNLEITVQCQKNAGTSVIQLKGWESIDTLRGQAFDLIVLDEVASMKNWDENWRTVVYPTLTDRVGEVLFISTPKGFNDFYTLYNMESSNPDYKSFHFTSFDNPFLKKDELEKARLQLTEDQFAQEYMADFRKMEGLVYKEFNRTYHTTKERPSNIDEYFAGVDFGFVHPCAVLHIAIDRKGVWWVIDEWYKRGRTEDQVSAYVKSCGFSAVYPDPAMPGAIETMNRMGVPVREVKKGKDSVKTGIDKIRNLLKQNRLKICNTCPNLISEFERYVYEGATEVPVKENDDALDALRYAVMTRVQTGAESSSSYVQPAWESPMQGDYGPTTQSPQSGKLLHDFEWQSIPQDDTIDY